MKKRELEALVEAQAAEIADLRRRVEELEARPIVNAVTITREVPAPRLDPWTWPPNDTAHPPFTYLTGTPANLYWTPAK